MFHSRKLMIPIHFYFLMYVVEVEKNKNIAAWTVILTRRILRPKLVAQGHRTKLMARKCVNGR